MQGIIISWTNPSIQKCLKAKQNYYSVTDTCPTLILLITHRLRCLPYGKTSSQSYQGKIPWRRIWQSALVFWPGESHGSRSLAGYGPQGCKESDTTEATQHARTIIMYIQYNIPKHTLTFTIVLGRFLKNSFGFSTTGRGGSFLSSCSTVVAARFLESFLLFPSPSAENSPTDTRVTKLFMCGGPLSLITY